jgi:polysaccharide chain length determinant protein (PEP-CTERM system associated)
MHELVEQLLSQLRAAWRYRWYAAATAWVVALAGWALVHHIPNRYEARARVFVDTQSMLRPLLSGLAVQPNVDQVVTMMGRTLVSRPNMERVIDMAGFEPSLDSNAQREQLISRLIGSIELKSAGRENLYTISYTDGNPERAKRVVESLFAIFLESSVGSKRRDSDSAREFIEEQLESYNEKLVAAESAVVDFKRRHQGLLPGEGRDFYSALNEAREALRKSTLDLNEAVNSRDAIQKQLADLAQPVASTATEAAAPTAPPSELDKRIQALQQKLDGLRLVYTDQHPDIVASVRIIEQLKAQKAAEEAEDARALSVPSVGGERPATRIPRGPLYEQLKVSLAAAEANVAAMRARVAEYNNRYNELQATAHALPQIEAEYKQLTRDYEVIKSRYDRLLERRESAQISGAVEASEAAMGFRVVDPPRVPHEPSFPKRPQLMSLVLLAALAAGAGLAFLLSQLKTTFGDERRLREASGLRVLGSVAMSWNPRQKRRRAGELAGLVVSMLGLLGAYGAVMANLMLAAARG